MNTLTPYLCCSDASAAIAFYGSALGATETERWTADDGRIGHAELDVAGNRVYLADEHPEIGVVSPTTLGRTPVSLVLEVPDADAAVERAVAAGATVERPVADQPGGRRAGWIVDPYGHRWNLTATTEPAPAPAGRVGGYQVTRPAAGH
jgi:PhnB protein